MIDVPSAAAIANMSEPQLLAAHARLVALFAGGALTADEQAQLLLALQHIKTTLLRKRLALRR